MRYKLIFLVIVFVFNSCASYQKDHIISIDPKDIHKLDFIGFYNIPGIGQNKLVYNQLTGVITRFSNDPDNETNFGKFVEFKHRYLHQDKGKIKYEEFYTVYGMLGEVLVDFFGELDVYMEIGKTGGSGPVYKLHQSDILLCVWSYEKSDFLIDYFDCKPVKYNGVYWYSPEKIVSK